MRLGLPLLRWLAVVLFLAGVIGGLALSGGVLWGEIEARVYTFYRAEAGVRLNCPLMISPAESGIIEAPIVNLTNQEIKPVVLAEVSHEGGARKASRTIPLGPRGIETFRLSVDRSDMIFDRLILVNVLQSSYGDNPSRLGSCGILLFSLFGLSGSQTFGSIFAFSLVCILLGSGLWLYAQRPLNDTAGGLAQAGATLAALTIAAMLSSLPRWWGFILLFDAIILLMIGVILTEFIVIPQKQGK
jgi:hypothetical protein